MYNVCAGIRGFGVRDEQKAVIEFGKPLTLITGQNGAGKTVKLVTINLKPIYVVYMPIYVVYIGVGSKF